MPNVCQAGLRIALLPALLMVVAPSVDANPQVLAEAVRVQTQTDADAARSQEQIDRLAEQTREMFDEYRAAMQEIEQLRIYNEQMQNQVDQQEREIASLQRQIDDFEQIERGVTPLMARMVDTLEQFIELDAPFLPQERNERLQRVRELMDDPNVAVGERYRRLMEAYTIEMDYSRNIDAYEGMLDFGGAERQVNFLRVGRLALLYQTLDRSETGYWDAHNSTWVVLGDEYRTPVNEGIRMARRLAAPNLISLPITAPGRN